MKAIAQDRYGPADVLELRDIDPPAIGEEEVLVRVRAAGVDKGVWHLVTGRPYLIRAVGFGLRAPKVPVRGREVSGVVEAIGPRVTRLRTGDEVYGIADRGSFAEYAAVPEAMLVPKPARLSFEQAAAIPVSAISALQALRDVAGVRTGQRVMVIGAGGGVGSFAVQIARAFGASVTGVCTTAKVDLVRGLGAEDVIDYTREEIDRDGPRYDAIVDTAGNRPLSLLRRALAPRGTLVIVGGDQAGGPLLGGFDRQLRAPLVSLIARRRLRALMARERLADLAAINELVESGAVTPLVDRTYPLAEAPDAIRYVGRGHCAGKVVVTI